jgi:hypothetical protein
MPLSSIKAEHLADLQASKSVLAVKIYNSDHGKLATTVCTQCSDLGVNKKKREEIIFMDSVSFESSTDRWSGNAAIVPNRANPVMPNVSFKSDQSQRSSQTNSGLRRLANQLAEKRSRGRCSDYRSRHWQGRWETSDHWRKTTSSAEHQQFPTQIRQKSIL